MNKVVKIILILFIIGLAIEIISALIMPAVVLGAGFAGYIMYKKRKANRQQKAIENQKQAQLEQSKQTIEYKMTYLLEVAGFDTKNLAKRTAYKHSTSLDLLDMWYKYLDLRAKLHLNNTSTSREEAVLHLMCDEVYTRLENVEVEVSNSIKKEFIIENITPLLSDIVDIMEGIRPIDSIEIDAYQLLNKSKGEPEPILEQLSR